MATKKRPRLKRGVSLADYELFRRMIASGKTTWRKLEKAGLVRSAGKRAWRQEEVLRKMNGAK